MNEPEIDPLSEDGLCLGFRARYSVGDNYEATSRLALADATRQERDRIDVRLKALDSQVELLTDRLAKPDQSRRQQMVQQDLDAIAARLDELTARMEAVEAKVRGIQTAASMRDGDEPTLRGTVQALSDRIECLERDSLQRLRLRERVDVRKATTIIRGKRAVAAADGVVTIEWDRGDHALGDAIDAAVPVGHRFRVTIQDLGPAEEPKS